MYDTRLDLFLARNSNIFSRTKVPETVQSWSCSTFINQVLDDPEIEQFISQVSGLFKRILLKYSAINNSPEGVQDIMLYIDREISNPFYNVFFSDILLKASITKANNKFIGLYGQAHLTEGAMQKPYKMTQIVNALVPPKICDNIHKPNDTKLVQNVHETSLFQPNSFYVQAYIHEEHINFILNKVVVVSSTGDAEQKSTFTVQERTIDVEHIAKTASRNIWNHLQMLDIELEEDCDDKFSNESYVYFKNNIKELMSTWVRI